MFNFIHVSRWQAAAVHFAISVAIALCACALILLVWYPGPLFTAVGGLALLGLIVGVDVCLGPLMTLIVFNPQKARKLIILDLSIISLVQIAALLYGVYSTFLARPVFVVYHQAQFVVITANEMEPEWLKEVQDPRYKTLPIWGPQWVSIRQPNIKEMSDFSFYEALAKVTGLGVQSQPKYYAPLENAYSDIKKSAQDLSKLRHKHPELSAGEDVGFIPFPTKQQNMSVLIDKKTGKVLDVLGYGED